MSLSAITSPVVSLFKHISSKSWKYQIGLLFRIAEIVLSFGVLINAALDMTQRVKENLNPATDGLITYSLALSLLAIFWCVAAMIFTFEQGWFHWVGDGFCTLAFVVMSAMYTGRYESSCSEISPHIWNFSQITKGGACNRIHADLAFGFMTTIPFVLSFLLDCLIAHMTGTWFRRQEFWDAETVPKEAETRGSEVEV